MEEKRDKQIREKVKGKWDIVGTDPNTRVSPFYGRTGENRNEKKGF